MHYLIFLFLLFSIPIIIGLLTSKLIYNYIKEKTYNKYYKLLALIPILLVGYFYWELFFPSNSFYKNKFEEITTIELPNDSNIIYKDSSFLGETILFTIEVPTPFYNSTLSEFIEKGYQESKVYKISNPPVLKSKRMIKSFSIEYYSRVHASIAFFDDNKTIRIYTFDPLT